MINNTNRSYRNLITPYSSVPSYLVFGTVNYPVYGYVDALNQSTNLGGPTGLVYNPTYSSVPWSNADMMSACRLIKSPSNTIIAFGMSMSSSENGSAMPFIYESIDNGVSFYGVKPLTNQLFTVNADFNPCQSIAYSGTTYSMVIKGNSWSYSNILYSTDAKNWTLAASYSTTNLKKVIWVPEKGRFYYSSNSSTWYTSTNGSTITTLSQSDAGVHSDLIYCSGLNKFVKSVDTGTAFAISMAVSTDCQNWSSPSNIVARWGGLQNLSYSPDLNLIFGVGLDNSKTGYGAPNILTNLIDTPMYITDTSLPLYPTSGYNEPRQVQWLKNSQMFVMTRKSRELRYSRDGITWTSINPSYPALVGYSPVLPPYIPGAFVSLNYVWSNNILEVNG